MSSFRIRPHFVHQEELSLDDYQRKIVDFINDEGVRCEVKSFPAYLTLVIPEEEQHFWSPQLNLSLESDEGSRTSIRGTYGPGTNVWSLFLYGYLTSTCLAGIATVFAISHWVVNGGTRGFILMGVACLIPAALYLTAQVGQKLGAQQTFQLHQIYESAVGRSITVH